MRLGWKGWLAVVMSACVIGCDGHVADEGPRRVAEGHHELHLWNLWLEDEPLLVTRRLVEGADARLHLLPLAELSAACEAAVASDRLFLQPVTQVLRGDGGRFQMERDSLIWFRDLGAPTRTMGVLDLGCQWREPFLEDVATSVDMVQVSPDHARIDGHIRFARTAAGELWRLDAYAGTAESIATDVARVQSRPHIPPEAPKGVLTVEAGEIVLRSLQGNEEARYGSSVSRVTYGKWNDGQHVFADSEGVHYVEQEGADPVLVEAGGCNPSLWEPYVFLHSPCDERRLVVHDLSQGSRYEYMSGVRGVLSFAQADAEGPPQVVVATGQGQALDVSFPLPSAPYEAVWWAQTPDDVVLVAEGVVSVSSIAALPFEEQPPTDLTLVLVDEGDTRALARFSAEEGLEVVRGGLPGLIGTDIAYTRLEGDLADIARLDPATGELQPLASDVPVGRDPWRNTFFLPTHDDVPLVYIRDADPETLAGTLEVRHPSGEVEVLDHGVTGFAVPSLPFGDHVGIVAYTVVDGDRTGVWIAPDILPVPPPEDLTP
jgi:hypothetical protein